MSSVPASAAPTRAESRNQVSSSVLHGRSNTTIAQSRATKTAFNIALKDYAGGYRAVSETQLDLTLVPGAPHCRRMFVAAVVVAATRPRDTFMVYYERFSRNGTLVP
jgi:hypothetical protein